MAERTADREGGYAGRWFEVVRFTDVGLYAVRAILPGYKGAARTYTSREAAYAWIEGWEARGEMKAGPEEEG